MSLSIIIVLSILFAFILMGMPVFLAMGITGLVGLSFLKGSVAFLDATLVSYRGAESFVLIAVPLFVFCGTLMDESKASELLYNLARKWVSSVPNGLGAAVVLSCGIFAAISGSSVATAATIGIVALPLLAEQGYPPKSRGTLVAAGGTLGILIPPSITMILIANLIGESVGKLFMAGLLPGFVLTCLFLIYVVVFSKPRLRNEKVSWKERFVSLRKAALVLALPLLILGAIYGGLATPTEISGIACMYCLPLGIFVYKTIKIKNLLNACMSALLTTVMIMMIVCFGNVLSYYFTLAQLPQTLAALVTEIHAAPIILITVMLAIYLILGCFMEAVSMVLLTVPMFFPIFESLQISPFFFAVFVTISMELAQITPPIGINLYVVSGIGNINIQDMIKGVFPYVVAMILTIYIVWFCPFLYRFIPGTMKF